MTKSYKIVQDNFINLLEVLNNCENNANAEVDVLNFGLEERIGVNVGFCLLDEQVGHLPQQSDETCCASEVRAARPDEAHDVQKTTQGSSRTFRQFDVAECFCVSFQSAHVSGHRSSFRQSCASTEFGN
jgi:hypothetical protein